MYTKRNFYLIAVLLVTLIWGCNTEVDPLVDALLYPTGNEDFNLDDAINSDPLGDHRGDGGDSTSLPQRVDYSDQMPLVRSQGSSSSCTSWAVGYYGKTYQEVQEEGWDPDDNAFSPAYLYAMQCRNYDQPWSIIRAQEILQRNGIAKWESLPFQDLSANGNLSAERENYADLTIPAQAHEEAKIYRCGESASGRSLTSVKNMLTQGPVVLSMWKFASPPLNPSPEENYMRYDSGSSGGHAILCVGYDDGKFGNGALKFINSWGSKWGENGYSWIRYSDFSKLIRYAVTYKDLPNPNNPDEPPDVDSRPDPPSDVEASDDAGNYVDIAWSRVAGAQYYRIYRSVTGDNQSYAELGVSYRNDYRDYPAPGIDYYYAVVAVNDLGESDHYPSDTDSEGHVDIGSAVGDVLATPTLRWVSNDSDGSHFGVDNIDPAATSMEVLVSTASAGPWNSLGWIRPDDFVINWGTDSEYANKKPFVRVRVANESASSGLSEHAQVGDSVDNDVEVGKINAYMVTPKADSILLRWNTDGGNVDFFEIWRYNASSDTASEWIKIGYTNPGTLDADNLNYYEDKTPLPGVPYFYVVVPVYQGTYGEPAYSDDPFKIEDDGANLKLKYFSYYYAQITSPTEFPEVIVRNDGSTTVNSYTIGILAYDWTDRKAYLVETVRVDEPLEAGHQHSLRLSNVVIPNAYADGHVYSWGIRVDQEQEIDETYEDDNVLWSNDGWWLETGGIGGEAHAAAPVRVPRLGTTLPFGNPLDGADTLQYQIADGEDRLVIYNGPSQHVRPDLSNDHAK